MIKLVVSDLDGTLFNAQHVLDEKDSKIITDLQNEGFQFMIATGRSYAGAKDIVEVFGLQCDYILLNGAIIMDKDKNLLQEIVIKQDTLKEIISLMQKEDAYFHMYGKQGTITFDKERGINVFIEHLVRNGCTKEEAREILEKGKFSNFDVEVKDIETYIASKPIIYKVELFSTDTQCQQRIREQLSNIQGIEVTNSVADNIEITDHQAQKGFALKHYCEQHGIKLDEVIVFGDSLNDENMISMFPYSFAMENAMDIIKEKANYLTDSNVAHGVTNVLKELMQYKGSEECLKNFKKKIK